MIVKFPTKARGYLTLWLLVITPNILSAQRSRKEYIAYQSIQPGQYAFQYKVFADSITPPEFEIKTREANGVMGRGGLRDSVNFVYGRIDLEKSDSLFLSILDLQHGRARCVLHGRVRIRFYHLLGAPQNIEYEVEGKSSFMITYDDIETNIYDTHHINWRGGSIVVEIMDWEFIEASGNRVNVDEFEYLNYLSIDYRYD